jgi:hypothetical protein
MQDDGFDDRMDKVPATLPVMLIVGEPAKRLKSVRQRCGPRWLMHGRAYHAGQDDQMAPEVIAALRAGIVIPDTRLEALQPLADNVGVDAMADGDAGN